MKLKKTKNAVRNIIFGFVYKMIAIFGPFAVRTAIIYVLGNEYTGLNSLFTSILSFLSLAELGVGNALVYSMYKPIAEDDENTICALLNLYRKLYRFIGLIILAVGLLLTPFLRFLVKGDVPADTNMYVLYLIYLGNTVISYVMFAYKQSLLTAFQRSDIISKRSAVIQLLMYIIQITVLILAKNYYLYLIWLPVFTVITNLANSVIVDHMFPQYKCRGEISAEQKKSITNKVLALFGTKANSIIMHAADNIVISAYLGLVICGQYGNYYYIMNAVCGIMTIVYDSLTAGLGNSLEVDSKEKIEEHFRIITFLNAWLVVFCTACLLCLYQPFMEIWVKPKNMLGNEIVLLLVVYFFVYSIRRIILTYKDAAGIWWEDRLRPYIMIVVNIVSNLILVNIIGLSGVILSTILSMLVSIPWENYTVFKFVFHSTAKQYYLRMLYNTFCCALICAVTWWLCSLIPHGWTGLVFQIAICVTVSNVLFILLNIKSRDLTASVGFFKNKLLGRRK